MSLWLFDWKYLFAISLVYSSIIGGPVFAILLGLIIAFFPRKEYFQNGIAFTSKKILQYAIVLLGFDMNLFDIFKVGSQSLLIIISTISTSLIISYLISKLMKIPSNVSILVGVGSSICGGSAIAATAPVIDANDEDIAKSISVIFLFNVIAAFLFPVLGNLLGLNDIGFGMWAGTAINDTSSVVAAGQTWASSHGNDIALNYATIVKLTRTLAIIPITVILALYRSKKNTTTTVNFSKIFPWFILFFLLAAVISTVFNITPSITKPLSNGGKFFITMAMGAIGLNTNIIKLVKTSGKPIIIGLCCWISIAFIGLIMQHLLHIG
ncbi:MAG: YeiH family protein [Clostridium sp.]|nr:YeiH family protein [Clostridium sp.]